MATSTESIGRVLARRYRIESALGRGTSATVYAAWDVVLQRRVAIKVLHPGLAGDKSFLRRFRYEAQSAAQLTHPHVLAVYDWGEDDRGPFLVLEYLGGGSLRDLLDNGRRVSVAQAAALGVQAAEALAYAHGRGFVHRDIKPANLVFDEDGRLRVADFGLARALAEAAMTEPSGATVGTARYAAPEQALGHPVDGRADVYSLGLTLYEAVTGVVPFTADTTTATLMARVGARIPGHDGLGPLAAVLDAAVTPDIDGRLDATGLARRLSELGATLPAPDPLPLAGAGGLGVAQAGARATDRTEHGMGPLAELGPNGWADSGQHDPDAMAMATAVGVADHQRPRDSGPAERGATDSQRRRWPWVVSIVVLVLALAAAGGAYAASRTKLFVPSHRLAAITGLTPTQAQELVKADHFHLRVTNRRTSATVASGRIIRQIPGVGTSLKQGATISAVVSTGPPQVAVPSLAAITGDCPAVIAALKAAHLNPSCTHANSTTVKSGTVISWTPTGHATEFSTVTVTVSGGPPTETIPSLTGSTCAGATTALQAVGLVPSCSNAYSSTVPSGEVISWTPTGTALEGSTVAISVSEGPQPVTVPADLVGMTVNQATAALEAVGLVPAADGPLVGHVFDASPAPGTSVPPGTTVTLYIK